MFDPRAYREACDRVTLDTGKIEEMITMTENQEKRTPRRLARGALVAAAMAAALCVTAAAAELPAVKEFFATVFVTVSTKGDPALGLKLPNVAVEERDGRTVLVVDEEKIDVTEALTRKGEYLYEGDGFEVAVDKNGVAVVTSYGENGMTVTYSTQDTDARGGMVYKVDTEDPGTVDGQGGSHEDYQVVVDVEAPEGAETEGMTVYNVVTDASGAVQVSPIDGK